MRPATSALVMVTTLQYAHRWRWVVTVMMALLIATACAYPTALPEQNALAAIRTADAVYLTARQWANAERDAGRLSEERFDAIAQQAERLRLARETLRAAVTAYLAVVGPSDPTALITATKALTTATELLDKGAKHAS